MFIFSRSVNNFDIEAFTVENLNWLQVHLVTTKENEDKIDRKLLEHKKLNSISLPIYSVKAFIKQYDKFLKNMSFELGAKMTTTLVQDEFNFFDAFVLTVRTGPCSNKKLCGHIPTLKTLINRYKLVHTSPVFDHFDSQWNFYIFEPYMKSDLLIK